jgi:hypothetical protein
MEKSTKVLTNEELTTAVNALIDANISLQETLKTILATMKEMISKIS